MTLLLMTYDIITYNLWHYYSWLMTLYHDFFHGIQIIILLITNVNVYVTYYTMISLHYTLTFFYT